MASGYDINELKRRMQGALGVLKTELNGLRTGRASAHLLDPIHVDAYGQHSVGKVGRVAEETPLLTPVVEVVNCTGSIEVVRRIHGRPRLATGQFHDRIDLPAL